MEKYFNINYEFDKGAVHAAIEKQLKKDGSDYICVADGVILNNANRKPEYLEVINGGMFSICDSGYVPMYLKLLYGIKREQYCGSDIFKDIVSSKKYRMFFMGTTQRVLDGLKEGLSKMNPDVKNMSFYELPFKSVEDFDYEGIARMIEADGADIVWVALGAPKQEIFMSKLKPHLKHGVIIAVGAAFNFFSGTSTVKRAPKWMVKSHLEFVYRISQEPKKQLKRCGMIIVTLPMLLIGELIRKYSKK